MWTADRQGSHVWLPVSLDTGRRDEDWSRVHGPGDDEEEFGSNHAERRGQHACALGRSIAVHFSYSTSLADLLPIPELRPAYVAIRHTFENPFKSFLSNFRQGYAMAMVDCAFQCFPICR